MVLSRQINWHNMLRSYWVGGCTQIFVVIVLLYVGRDTPAADSLLGIAVDNFWNFRCVFKVLRIRKCWSSEIRVFENAQQLPRCYIYFCDALSPVSYLQCWISCCLVVHIVLVISSFAHVTQTVMSDDGLIMVNFCLCNAHARLRW